MINAAKLSISSAYEMKKTTVSAKRLSEMIAIDRPDRIVTVKEIGRPIFVLKNRAYYISTGQNSGHANTIFPFYGLQFKPALWFIKPRLCVCREIFKKISYGKKLNLEEEKLFSFNKSDFQNEFIAEIDKLFGEKIRKIFATDESGMDLLVRFGNMEDLIVSYLINYGIWNDYSDDHYTKMMEIIKIIDSDYKELKEKKVKDLKESGLDIKFKEMKKNSEKYSEDNYSYFNTDDNLNDDCQVEPIEYLSYPEEINQFLFRHGAFTEEEIFK